MSPCLQKKTRPAKTKITATTSADFSLSFTEFPTDAATYLNARNCFGCDCREGRTKTTYNSDTSVFYVTKSRIVGAYEQACVVAVLELYWRLYHAQPHWYKESLEITDDAQQEECHKDTVPAAADQEDTEMLPEEYCADQQTESTSVTQPVTQVPTSASTPETITAIAVEKNVHKNIPEPAQLCCPFVHSSGQCLWQKKVKNSEISDYWKCFILSKGEDDLAGVWFADYIDEPNNYSNVRV